KDCRNPEIRESAFGFVSDFGFGLRISALVLQPSYAVDTICGMDFNQLLHFAVENNASDVHIQAGLQTRLRVGGIMRSVNLPAVTDEQVRTFIASIAPPRMHDNFEERLYKGMD